MRKSAHQRPPTQLESHMSKSFVITFMPVTTAESALLELGYGPDREEIIKLASTRTFGGDKATPEHTQPDNEVAQLISTFMARLCLPVNSTEFSVPVYTLAAQLSLLRIKCQSMEVRSLLASNLAAYAQLKYFDRCVSDVVCAAAAGMYSDVRITIDTIGE